MPVRQTSPRAHRCAHLPPAVPARFGARAGMSLLEAILAIAVAGFVLAAAASFLVSISSIWSQHAQRHFFSDHVDSVTEFLNASFANAGVEIALQDAPSGDQTSARNRESSAAPEAEQPLTSDNPSEGTPAKQSAADDRGLLRTAAQPISWAQPPGFANYQAPLLNFTLAKAPPLLIDQAQTSLLGVNIFLYLTPDEGLSLLWYSKLQDERDDINDLRRTTISPWVTAMRYIYWDESFEQWEEHEEPQKEDGEQQFLLPRFVKLVFEYEGETQERTLTIPVPSKGVLIF